VAPPAVTAVVARARPPRPSAISGSPRVRVDPFTSEGTPGAWTVRWGITNDGDRPIRLLSAQQPHSQFRTPETKLDEEIRPGAQREVALPVRFSESPGVVVENPFLIVVFHENADWRLLARVRVIAGTRGEPIAGDSVVITTQRVGAAEQRD
jgi:hypothetical protein